MGWPQRKCQPLLHTSFGCRLDLLSWLQPELALVGLTPLISSYKTSLSACKHQSLTWFWGPTPHQYCIFPESLVGAHLGQTPVQVWGSGITKLGFPPLEPLQKSLDSVAARCYMRILGLFGGAQTTTVGRQAQVRLIV